MAPNIKTSNATLSCPLFAADFDPRNHDYLLVGGGGGESRSGVGNRISLLNTSKPDEVSELVEIDLSRDEDSVMSLGAAQSSDGSLIALAGINSSQAEQQQDKNEHLRSFQIDYPFEKGTPEPEKRSKRKEKSKTAAQPRSKLLAQLSLFKSQASKTGPNEIYQRILRLSQWAGEDSQRIGAIATGLAPKGEIILFNANTSIISQSDVLGRVTLGAKEEAEDLDIISYGENGNFNFAYTDGRSISLSNISIKDKSKLNVRSVYGVESQSFSKDTKQIRAMRFLTPDSLVLLRNYPGRAGCELVVLTLPQSGRVSKCTVAKTRRLHKSMKVGLGLDVCALNESASGERQFIIGTSGNDLSLEILTLEYSPQNKRNGGYGPLQKFAVLTNVHPFSITRIVFSTFKRPTPPITPEAEPSCVKLASVSVGNSVVVHTLPLSPYPATSKDPRFVLSKPGRSETIDTLLSVIIAAIFLILSAFIFQVIMEVRGGVPPTLGAAEWLSPRLREVIARPYLQGI